MSFNLRITFTTVFVNLLYILYQYIFKQFHKKAVFPSIASWAKNDTCRLSEKLSVNNVLCAYMPVTKMFVLIFNDGFIFDTEQNS